MLDYNVQETLRGYGYAINDAINRADSLITGVSNEVGVLRTTVQNAYERATTLPGRAAGQIAAPVAYLPAQQQQAQQQAAAMQGMNLTPVLIAGGVFVGILLLSKAK